MANSNPTILIVPPTAIDLLDAVSNNLIVNAKRGLQPQIDILDLQTRAERIVNQDAVIPLISISTGS